MSDTEPDIPELMQKKRVEEAPTASGPQIWALRTTASREDQVFDFLTSNITKKKLEVYVVIRPHCMR